MLWCKGWKVCTFCTVCTVCTWLLLMGNCEVWELIEWLYPLETRNLEGGGGTKIEWATLL
jgi:hypothetical protein